MKRNRKCIQCGKLATKRIGKYDVCDDCKKLVLRQKKKYVVDAKPVCVLGNKLQIFADYFWKAGKR